MYRHQQPSIFNFGGGGGGFKRQSIVTFKSNRDLPFRPPPTTTTIIASTNKPNVEQLPTLSLSCSSTTNSSLELDFSSQTPTTTIIRQQTTTATMIEPNKEEEEQADIFDFPDTAEESLEVKLMVASIRSIPKKTTLKKSKSNSSLNSSTNKKKKACLEQQPKKKPSSIEKKMTLADVSTNTVSIDSSNQQQQQDEFAFDYNPHIKVTHNTNNTIIHFNKPTTSTKQLISISSLLNDPQPKQPPPPPPPPPPPLAVVEKKRKRNLVAHLKSASGEKENKPFISSSKERDFISDEDDEYEQHEKEGLLPVTEIIQKERSLSPELTYQERMELELESLLNVNKREEQNQQITITTTNKRQEYRPMNKLNVKFTFKRN